MLEHEYEFYMYNNEHESHKCNRGGKMRISKSKKRKAKRKRKGDSTMELKGTVEAVSVADTAKTTSCTPEGTSSRCDSCWAKPRCARHGNNPRFGSTGGYWVTEWKNGKSTKKWKSYGSTTYYGSSKGYDIYDYV